ncbi:monovalent cation/H+ antiporter complex subunit F [Kribbella sp.]|uniref:monovalent cation/H+ antiporter complex subunit F n=1 Tax=Kribbella sp. TaxID=1871183 RepID=UPI002D642324|nr:monovalent cation/H+ antiporter complex subunit F [Kribbella sp.]HZX07607.1 monovalent cation/H+ antiporter complex subunit F [Kribbella sp.]
MVEVFGLVAIAEVVVGGLLVVRIAWGPSVTDRVVALNAVSTQATLALLFFAAFADRVIYLDVALWMASFGYLGALVWARFLERGLL